MRRLIVRLHTNGLKYVRKDVCSFWYSIDVCITRKISVCSKDDIFYPSQPPETERQLMGNYKERCEELKRAVKLFI